MPELWLASLAVIHTLSNIDEEVDVTKDGDMIVQASLRNFESLYLVNDIVKILVMLVL